MQIKVCQVCGTELPKTKRILLCKKCDYSLRIEHAQLIRECDKARKTLKPDFAHSYYLEQGVTPMWNKKYRDRIKALDNY